MEDEWALLEYHTTIIVQLVLPLLKTSQLQVERLR